MSQVFFSLPIMSTSSVLWNCLTPACWHQYLCCSCLLPSPSTWWWSNWQLLTKAGKVQEVLAAFKTNSKISVFPSAYMLTFVQCCRLHKNSLMLWQRVCLSDKIGYFATFWFWHGPVFWVDCEAFISSIQSTVQYNWLSQLYSGVFCLKFLCLLTKKVYRLRQEELDIVLIHCVLKLLSTGCFCLGLCSVHSG